MRRVIIFISYIFIFSSIFGQDFEVAPVELNFNADPGEVQTKSITIKNHANRKTSYLISINDFLIDSRGNKSFHPPASTKNSIANWLNISPSFFELNPNEEKQVTVSVQSPVDSYNSAWGILFIQTVVEQDAFQADKTLTTGMNMSARIVVELFQSPKINTNKQLKINRLEEITQVGDSVRMFRANIDNLGDKITRCKVYLVASNLESAEETFFEPIEISTYPKSSRQVQLSLNKLLGKGKYALAAILDYGTDANLEGTQIIIDIQ